MPKTLKAGELQKLSGKDSRILWIEDLSGLIGSVQMNTLEFHVWGSDRNQPDLPERMVFDIDPDEGLGFEHEKAAPLSYAIPGQTMPPVAIQKSIPSGACACNDERASVVGRANGAAPTF